MADTTRYRDDPSIEEPEDIIQDGNGNSVVQSVSANSFFKRPLKIITWMTLVLIVLTISLLIVNIVFLSVWNFENSRAEFELNRNLAIVLLVTAIVTTPTLLAEIPILIVLIVYIIMAFQIIPFASDFFQWSFPNADRMCTRYNWHNGDYDRTPPTQECIEKVQIMQILISVAGGVGIFIGALVIALIVTRIVALFKAQFWKSRQFSSLSPQGFFSGFSKFTGVSVHLSFSMVPYGTVPVVVDTQSARVNDTTQEPEQERLIQT